MAFKPMSQFCCQKLGRRKSGKFEDTFINIYRLVISLFHLSIFAIETLSLSSSKLQEQDEREELV